MGMVAFTKTDAYLVYNLIAPHLNWPELSRYQWKKLLVSATIDSPFAKPSRWWAAADPEFCEVL